MTTDYMKPANDILDALEEDPNFENIVSNSNLIMSCSPKGGYVKVPALVNLRGLTNLKDVVTRVLIENNWTTIYYGV